MSNRRRRQQNRPLCPVFSLALGRRARCEDRCAWYALDQQQCGARVMMDSYGLIACAVDDVAYAVADVADAGSPRESRRRPRPMLQGLLELLRRPLQASGVRC